MASETVDASMEKLAISEDKKPIVCIVIGMAGSGKTTLMRCIDAYLEQEKKKYYTLNLDPAVRHVPYNVNIDIRDTVKYKEVMKQYNLGPNGAIVTSLNLFATRFDQVLGFLDKRAPSLDYIMMDTPGQIEVFTWSASGAIITESIASTYPTVLLYVIDTPRTTSPSTFISNMLYACSILYKTKLPMILVFNKCDITSPAFAKEWMTNFEAFNAACQADDTYMSSLTRSMSLVLEEFYNNLKTVGVSSTTGQGMDELFGVIGESRTEWKDFYQKEMERLRDNKKEKEEKRQEDNLTRLKKDLEENKGGKVVLDGRPQELVLSDDEEFTGRPAGNSPSPSLPYSDRQNRELVYRAGINEFCSGQEGAVLCFVQSDITYSATQSDGRFTRENGSVHYKLDLRWQPSFAGTQYLSTLADILVSCDTTAEIPVLSVVNVTSEQLSLKLTTRCQTVASGSPKFRDIYTEMRRLYTVLLPGDTDNFAISVAQQQEQQHVEDLEAVRNEAYPYPIE
ncbi:AAA ATPase domain-containing protein [Planoprotostelium fungivorum]|uniref:GPN-loop GTPase 1 n=1 Tax=Planoprotostelium fungivorum TaxID=1890364 RepID=A0A2P6MVB5_9EUKA|nr:AAA ATPase domain-containing protein [Planoprotostelium fungivorum]